MEREQIKEFSVQCDESDCDWRLNILFIKAPDWHKKVCPKCKKGEIINDKDLALWHVVNTILLLDEKINPKDKLSRMDITIDTSILRV